MCEPFRILLTAFFAIELRHQASCVGCAARETPPIMSDVHQGTVGRPGDSTSGRRAAVRVRGRATVALQVRDVRRLALPALWTEHPRC